MATPNSPEPSSDGLGCPTCGARTEVVETRPGRGTIERRRRCSLRCGGYIHTVEMARDRSEEVQLRSMIGQLLSWLNRYRRGAHVVGYRDPGGLAELVDAATRMSEGKL